MDYYLSDVFDRQFLGFKVDDITINSALEHIIV